ncbi:xanthine dehydrogenase family protein molybdopterin-binding subunit [Candidatus Puniceispirillum sp.]|nr:xanthine dehydrogenase family protein molybdopterin-binding subunit [Candidatus Puniceispirillum sp.]
MKFGIGQSAPRVEDRRLLIGAGCFSDDVFPGKGLHVAFLRAPYAHARMLHLDVSAARNLDGVSLVATQADLDADNVGDIECQFCPPLIGGGKMQLVSKSAMVRDINRHAGDIVAMVIAKNQEIADSAIELIKVEYQSMPVVTDIYAAMGDDASQLYDCYPNNTAFEWGAGNFDGTNQAMKAAIANGHKIVEVDVINNRVVINSMETRPMVVAPGKRAGSLDIWCGTQGVVGVAEQIAKSLSMDLADVHVQTGDVGGSFGFKIFLHPEQICIAWAARRLGVMVRWQQSRSDCFLSDLHGRDNRSQARAAIDEAGRILALEVTVHANMGSWLSNFSTYIPTLSGSRTLTTVYDIKAASLRVIGVMTNTPAVDAYRGAGRPEANYLMERLMDHIAVETGHSRLNIRRVNLIKTDQIPYEMVSGGTIDSGEILQLFEAAIEQADVAGFSNRRAQSDTQSKFRGIGFGMYLEQCGGGADEGVDIEFEDDGRIILYGSQQCNGQGHRTTITQILSDCLGYDVDLITVHQGDSNRSPRGTTGGARMAAVLGSATAMAAANIIDIATPLAAEMLDCDVDTLVFADGLFLVKDTNRSLTIEDLVRHLAQPGQMHQLNCIQPYETDGATYPYGCHIVEVEIDKGTCAVEVVRYSVMDDFGLVINPMTLAGQIHGGIVQGVGQALLENVVYDDSGQLLAGSLMDYALPRADHFPGFMIDMRNTPCVNNFLGIKGAGEAGAVGAPQAVISAVCDALEITHIDMPATPLKIFNMIKAKENQNTVKEEAGG